jgi:hypothetical protein
VDLQRLVQHRVVPPRLRRPRSRHARPRPALQRRVGRLGPHRPRRHRRRRRADAPCTRRRPAARSHRPRRDLLLDHRPHRAWPGTRTGTRRADRQLPAGRTARRGRDGRGLARRARLARPPGGDQADPARRPGRRRRGSHDGGAAVRAGGAGHRAAPLPAHDHALRLRPDRRRCVLLRHGAARRDRPPGARRPLRPVAARARRARAAPGLPLAGRGARAGPCPSRRQAGQHLPLPAGHRGRLRQGPGLRPGQAHRPELGRAAPYPGGSDLRNAVVHGARGGPRRGARSARRSVRRRLRRLLAARRPDGVSRRHRDEADPRHVGDTPSRPSLHGAVPQALDELVLRCLAKSPSERPATAQAIAAELDAVPVERPWTDERARAWWDANLPLAGPKPPPGPDSYAPTERIESPSRT